MIKTINILIEFYKIKYLDYLLHFESVHKHLHMLLYMFLNAIETVAVWEDKVPRSRDISRIMCYEDVGDIIVDSCYDIIVLLLLISPLLILLLILFLLSL